IIAALAAGLLLASPAAAQSSLEQRETTARAMFAPIVAEAGVEMLEEMRGMFRDNGYTAAEQAALELAFDAEAPAFMQGMEDIMVETAARHVPLEQIRADADFDSPEWTAAGDEVESWTQDAAIALAERVADRGCSVEASPSEQCLGVLHRLREARAGSTPG